MIIGEQGFIELMIRYNGIGKSLNHEETIILMAYLATESEFNGGIAKQALEIGNRLLEKQKARDMLRFPSKHNPTK